MSLLLLSTLICHGVAFLNPQPLSAFRLWSSLIMMEASSESSTDVNEVVENAPLPYQLKTAKRSKVITGVAPRSGPLNEAVTEIANLTSFEEANYLIDIGAVWAKMETLTEEEILDLYDSGSGMESSSKALYADLPKGWGDAATDTHDSSSSSTNNDENADLEEYVQQMESQRFRRVLSPSRVEAGTDIRIYPYPRRFTEACAQMTRDRLLYEDTTFIVVDKPPMLPTQPDASNYIECCPGCVQDNLGPFVDIQGEDVARPLLCHRVDACVGGCVVLSKDRNGQKVFQELQRDRKLRKVYLAVTTEPVPLGMHIQWMWAPQSSRGKSGGPPCQLVSHAPPESRRKARQFWNRCVLEVVNCDPIVIPKDNVEGYDPEDKQHYQITIRLVTGRKHQVRAQLASLGAPIIRDTLYQPMSGLTLDRLEDSEEDMDECIGRCRVPTEPIGLQAHAILFGGIRAKARTPWWGQDE